MVDADDSPSWLALDDVWLTYSPTVSALRGVSITVDRGEYVALLGPSGSGKSSLLHVLSGIRSQTSGHRTLCGVVDPNARERRELLRHSIAIVFQAFHLLPGYTAMENVQLGGLYAGMPRTERRQRSADALARVGLAHRGSHQIRELSGGEQQRVALARALVRGADVVLADEPTGNLDSVNAASVLDAFDELHEAGATVVLVTHDEDAAQRSQRVVRLHDGQVVPDSRRPR